MEKNEILDVIINLVRGCQQDRGELLLYRNNKTYGLMDCKYLLNKVLRAYKIPSDHYYISKEAKELWENISDPKVSKNDINKQYYKQKIYCEKDCGVSVEIFKGASKDPSGKLKLSKGSSFIYNDVFHDDHIVPIKILIDELVALEGEELNYDEVEKILDKICICRMLKTEDRKLENRYKRDNTVQAVIKNLYKEEPILLQDCKKI